MDQIIAVVGSMWIIALMIVGAAIVAEGGARPLSKTESESDGAKKKPAALALAAGLISTIGLVLLATHAWLSLAGSAARFIALGVVVFVGALGGTAGQGLAARSPDLHDACRKLCLPLAVIGVAAAAYAAQDTTPLFLERLGLIPG